MKMETTPCQSQKGNINIATWRILKVLRTQMKIILKIKMITNLKMKTRMMTQDCLRKK